MQLFGNGQRDGTANSAADDADIVQSLGLGGFSERSGKIGDMIALLKSVKRGGRGADDLKNYAHPSGGAVKAGDGEGNTLSLGVNAQDYELPCLGFARDIRRVDLHQGDGWIQLLFP